MGKEKTKGGKLARIGSRFFKAVEDIKDARLRNGKSKDRISTEKLTNMIVRHSTFQRIAEEIVEAPEEAINEYGK